MARLHGHAVAMVGGFTDHTYVTSSDHDVWPCAGRSEGGRMICSGSGSAWLASCLAGAHSTAGIVLSVTGWCHRMANRILRPAGVDVSAARGYGLTYHFYIHGGGWVIGSLDSHDGVCRRLALAGDFLVASVGYRLAPEHKFPAGLEDCLAAARWVAAHGADWEIDSGRLALGGDSAGADLALATLLGLRDASTSPMRGAVLIYGAYAADADTPSRHAYGDGSYIISNDDMHWFWGHYLNGEADKRNPLAAPLLADFRELPPLLVTACEFDPLLDDSERLVARLQEAGTPRRYAVWPGVTHAFIHMTRMLDVAQKHIADIASWLREQMSA